MNTYKGIVSFLVPIFALTFTISAHSYEISGSPFDTDGAPLPQKIQTTGEKQIVVDPAQHVWGAYNTSGKLIRWGIASAGSDVCADTGQFCRTKVGSFRIHSLGSEACASNKYDGASMPYCMYFNGSDAIHGSDHVEFSNISHGCVRVHVDDAKWLRFSFAEGPTATNQYRGTLVIIKPY